MKLWDKLMKLLKDIWDSYQKHSRKYGWYYRPAWHFEGWWPVWLEQGWFIWMQRNDKEEEMGDVA